MELIAEEYNIEKHQHLYGQIVACTVCSRFWEYSSFRGFVFPEPRRGFVLRPQMQMWQVLKGCDPKKFNRKSPDISILVYYQIFADSLDSAKAYSNSCLSNFFRDRILSPNELASWSKQPYYAITVIQNCSWSFALHVLKRSLPANWMWEK